MAGRATRAPVVKALYAIRDIMKVSIYLLSLVLIVQLTGCWDSAESPEIVNDTNSDYKLLIISSEKTQSYTIMSGGALLLPNILTEGDFISLEIENEEGTKVSLSKQEIISQIIEAGDNQFSLAKLVAKNVP